VGFTQVVAGAHHTCALDAAGKAWCWGANGAGQLGDGTTTDRFEPVPVQGGHSFVQLAAGGNPNGRDGHTCGMLSSGATLCWGSNVSGQLGTGAGGSTLLPTPVSGDHRFVLVVAGGAHSCALAVDGRAWCWGDDALGQLGTGQGSSPIPVPVSGDLVFLQLAAGGAGGTHTCGLAVDGRAYCWGSGALGQLGNGSTPAQAVTPEPVMGGRSYVRVAAGWGHTCGTPDRESPVDPFTPNPPFCWGLNAEGQLGDGTTVGRVIPTGVNDPLLHFMDIAAGADHTCGREIGFATQVYCWGDNSRGQLGIGAGVPQKRSPAEVNLPWG
jgi:alpha-tubulin suppressor-like RCC1 family protein